MRIKEMIVNLESFDCKTYSPSVLKEKYGKGMENMDTDAKV